MDGNSPFKLLSLYLNRYTMDYRVNDYESEYSDLEPTYNAMKPRARPTTAKQVKTKFPKHFSMLHDYKDDKYAKPRLLSRK